MKINSNHVTKFKSADVLKQAEKVGQCVITEIPVNKVARIINAIENYAHKHYHGYICVEMGTINDDFINNTVTLRIRPAIQKKK